MEVLTFKPPFCHSVQWPSRPKMGAVFLEATLFPIPDYSGSLFKRNTLTGDWGGRRTRLANNGVQVDANLT
jgi:carbohydrate-selective porin OprB